MINARRPRPLLAPLPEEGPAQPAKLDLRMQARRPQRRNRASLSWDPTIDIHEDTFAWKGSSSGPIPPFSDVTLTKSIDANRRSTLLAQPAQRIPLASTIDKSNVRGRRSSILPQAQPMNVFCPQVSTEHTLIINKEPRRRTIFIPSDDTTIATIHPGASMRDTIRPRRPRRSDIFLDIAESSEEVCQQDGTEQDVQTKDDLRRRPRASLAVPPRRVPLAVCARIIQPKAINRDVPGSGGGKENLVAEPLDVKCGRDVTLDLDFSPLLQTTATSRPSPKRRTSVAFGHGSDAQMTIPSATPVARAQSYNMPSLLPNRRTSFLPPQIRRTSIKPTYHLPVVPPKNLPTKLAVPTLRQSMLSSMSYSVLPEDLSKPDLYEENWLGHQETAITELLNCLFLSSSGRSILSNQASNLRSDLIAIYHDSSISLLYRRIQASLQYGALSISKDTLSQVGRYVDDIQQRQRFLDLWLKTYDLQSLQAAAEVVVGREMPRSVATSPTSCRPVPTAASLRRTIEAFLVTFLVRNEDRTSAQSSFLGLHDVETAGTDCKSPAKSWRMTVIRSLLLILLLDKAHNSGILGGCLFLNNSPLKSSAAVVQALGNLLLPSSGNIIRVLDHLSYHVSAIQIPLEEVFYRVENLATDLRDGVLLSRLVEILLFPQGISDLQDQSLTITVPTGEILTSECKTSSGQNGCWPISQHLKYPCTSRIQKIYNVQVALSALAGVQGAENLVNDISAEDIVDGHREKNVGLLWSLVCRWGLNRLVDFELIEHEISRLDKVWRLGQKYPSNIIEDECDDPISIHSQDLDKGKDLVKRWARNVGRLHSISISNLSTSFADGRAYAAIIAEYSVCMSSSVRAEDNQRGPTGEFGSTAATSPASVDQTLTFTLRSLGCSRAFISLFKNVSTIPSLHTTVPLLAFLASRLLPPARPHFAAICIQRQWRRRSARFEIKRRINLAILARECATVVQARDSIVQGAVKIQRWWRALEAYWHRPHQLERQTEFDMERPAASSLEVSNCT